MTESKLLCASLEQQLQQVDKQDPERSVYGAQPPLPLPQPSCEQPQKLNMGSASSIVLCSSSSSAISQPAPPPQSLYCHHCRGVISSGPSAFLAGQVNQLQLSSTKKNASAVACRTPDLLVSVGVFLMFVWSRAGSVRMEQGLRNAQDVRIISLRSCRGALALRQPCQLVQNVSWVNTLSDVSSGRSRKLCGGADRARAATYSSGEVSSDINLLACCAWSGTDAFCWHQPATASPSGCDKHHGTTPLCPRVLSVINTTHLQHFHSRSISSCCFFRRIRCADKRRCSQLPAGTESHSKRHCLYLLPL